MPIGTKLRALRKKRGITQSELAGDSITRGMLSRIENGSALPSLDTLLILAKRLEVSPGFLLEEGDNLLPAERMRVIKLLTKDFRDGDFGSCLRVFENSGIAVTQEIADIYICSAFRVGMQNFSAGDFITAKLLLNAAEKALPLLIVPIPEITEAHIDFVLFITEHIATLSAVIESAAEIPDFTFELSLFFTALKYLQNGQSDKVRHLIEFGCFSPCYEAFLKAKLLIPEYKFIDTILVLKGMINSADTPCFLALLGYSVIEECCKTCEDFKGAYESQGKFRERLDSIHR